MFGEQDGEQTEQSRNEARDVVAVVNLAAHSSMISLEELVDALGPHLVSTADRISARLGYRRPDETPTGWCDGERAVKMVAASWPGKS